MLNLIGGKANNQMEISATDLLNNLSNEELIMVAQAGKLEEFCYALSLDLQTYDYEKDTTYTA